MPTLQLDAATPGQPYDPYWKRVLCADRAGLSLRADVREQLAHAVRECGFQSLRQHGLFHDDMYVWCERDKPLAFPYVDANYDYYLSLGIRPFVELSFLPRWLASDDKTVFTVKCPACPPSDLAAWRRLVHETVRHVVARYGLDEVRSWNFEVWNEPNIPFWSGTQAQYFELYRTSVDAVKAVDAALRIGGPATANFVPDRATGEYRPCWVEEFLAFCDRERLPVDFVSTHPYPTDFPFDEVTRTHTPVVRERDATFHDLALLRRLVDASPFPQAAIHCNEWGTSPGVRDRTHDHVFSATFHLENLLRCLGLVDSLARWCLSDVSEEQVPGPSELHGGWGIVTAHGVRKPDFHAYRFLHRCGGTLLHNDWQNGLALFRGAAGWQLLLYNHHPYACREATWETIDGVEQMIGTGSPRSFDLTLTGLPPRLRITRSRLDREHGWVQKAWLELGAPDSPTPEQVRRLHEASEPTRDVRTELTEAGRLRLRETVPDLGVLFLELERV